MWFFISKYSFLKTLLKTESPWVFMLHLKQGQFWNPWKLLKNNVSRFFFILSHFLLTWDYSLLTEEFLKYIHVFDISYCKKKLTKRKAGEFFLVIVRNLSRIPKLFVLSNALNETHKLFNFSGKANLLHVFMWNSFSFSYELNTNVRIFFFMHLRNPLYYPSGPYMHLYFRKL